MSLRVGIENILESKVREAIYLPITFNKTSSEYEVGVTPVAPRYAKCKEVGAGWARDNRNNRSLKQDRVDWSFELRITFAQEVTLEPLEEWFREVYVIKPNTFGTHAGVQLEVASSNVDHSVTQQGSNAGTEVVYVVRAITRN